jgi:hypothetical protein
MEQFSDQHLAPGPQPTPKTLANLRPSANIGPMDALVEGRGRTAGEHGLPSTVTVGFEVTGPGDEIYVNFAEDYLHITSLPSADASGRR